jgi:hypothetical protein
VHGENQDVCIGRFFRNGSGNFQTIHFGHGEVEQDQVWFVSLDMLDSLEPGGCFTTDFQARLGFQQGAHAAAHDGMIIGDENAVRSGNRRFLSHEILLER